ncbi:MAG TPA: hypothetical protein VLB09_04435 [Nitrospiria bacterium]|nr:hypothetical protein [Nitrospiria bacterium]
MQVGDPSKAVNEPRLNILFGPPIEERQRVIFNLYQQAWKEEEESKLKGWEEFECDMIHFLFHREHDAPSTMDELFTRLQRVPVRISGYDLVLGSHGGYWVFGISIPVSRVSIVHPDGTWPPDKKICDEAGNALGFMLRREWVKWYAILPTKGMTEYNVVQPG